MEQFLILLLKMGRKMLAFRQYAQTFFRLFIIPIIMNLSLWGLATAKDHPCRLTLLPGMINLDLASDPAVLAKNWRQLYQEKIKANLTHIPATPKKIPTYNPDQAFWDGRQALVDAYESLFIRNHLQASEMEILAKVLPTFPEEPDQIKLLEEYLLFVRTIKKSKQADALKEVKAILEAAQHPAKKKQLLKNSSLAKAFARQQKRIQSAYDQKKDVLLDEIVDIQKHPELADKSMLERQQWAEEQAEEYRMNFRNKWNGCHTHGKTPEYSSARTKFFFFSMITGTGSSLFAFYVNNKSFIENGQEDIFYRRLKYELGETLVWRLLSYGVSVRDNWSFLAKSAAYYGADNVLSYASGRAWDYFVGSKEQKDDTALQNAMAYIRMHQKIDPGLQHSQEIDTFLEKVWNNGEAVPLLREVLDKMMDVRHVPSPEILQKAGLLAAKDLQNADAIKAAAQQYWQDFGKMLIDPTTLLRQGLITTDDFHNQEKIQTASALYWQNFGRQMQDQSDDQIQALMSLVAKDIYLDLAEEAAFSTGSSIADRYGFYSIYGLFMVPTDLLFMRLVYEALCMSDMASWYFIKAALMFAAFRLAINLTFEHTARKAAINQ